jgi:Ser-tRNA(Ala) deacylase AlaX
MHLASLLFLNLPSFLARRMLSMSANGVSLLTCQRNAYIRESLSTVLSCEKYPDRDNFRVVLDDSVLYPEGGGQPYDLGTINGFSVLKVLKPSTGQGVEAEISAALEVGATVKCELDWNRRYDFMQQHTAQVI